MNIKYLQRGYKETFYFRIAVPVDLRHILKRTHIRRSLKTTDENTAIIKAQYWLAKTRKQFDTLRSLAMSSDKDDLQDWSKSDEFNYLLNQGLNFSRQDISIAKVKITDREGREIELHDVVTDPNRPEEFEFVKTLIQPTAPPVIATPAQVQPVQPSPDTGRKLSDLIAPFLEEKKTANRSNRYVDAIKDAVENFIEFTGDIDPALIHKGHARKFAKALETWPSNRRKMPRYTNLNIHQILKLDIPKEDRITEVTYNNIVRKLSTFMIWLREENHISIDNPFSKLFKEEKSAKEQWTDFSRDDIKNILSTKHLVFDAEQPSRYWIPLLLAHSGARIEEICSLYKDDIDQDPETEICFFQIRKNRPDKMLKTKQSVRTLPVHSHLIERGFLDYVKSVPVNTRLFPDLTFKQDFGYHVKISRHFSRYLKKIGLTVKLGEKKSLKSFRHSVMTELYNNNVSAGLVEEIVGHVADQKSMSLSRYHKGYHLKPKLEALEKISWNLD